MKHIEHLAATLAELFEEILDKHNIVIPDEDREGRDGEACLYGMTYWNLVEDLEEEIISKLESLAEYYDDLVVDIVNETEGTESAKQIEKLDEAYLDADNTRHSLRTVIEVLNKEAD